MECVLRWNACWLHRAARRFPSPFSRAPALSTRPFSSSASPCTPGSQLDPASLFTKADQASHYATYRPRYPQELYDSLYANVLPGRKPPFNDLTVVDIATGSGQALGPMPEDFGSCIALDVSPAQLAEVPERLRSRIQVRLGDAHATGLPYGSVDLVTVGQAMHWFRLEDFYTECRRILKPSGALAAWTYDFGKLRGFPGSEQLYEQFYKGLLGPYWARGRELVDVGYAGAEPGPEHFGETRFLRVPMNYSVSLDDLVGQLRSWSGYHSYLKANPTQPDPVDLLQQQLAQRMTAASAGRLTLERVLTLLIALRPQPL
ncbi:hypothetical protein Agub_g7109 [Astrephomene gubernaculifera]|uniref:Methyltransferase type 11 domain-containing protein n=1 Tax=Astrephomene gubernaculifera TaxID=47775 RepID=A0AAD3HLG6_9CHLO|nr:hypothetical protein Agub_g7109 [Astrephomene gubernaculifera]